MDAGADRVLNLTARQEQLADAALSLIAQGGLQAASFRAIATEAGCSLGAVQKAFPSREVLLSAAFSRLREKAAAPVLVGEPGRPTLRGWIVELLLSVLPLDDQRRDAQRQADAFSQWILSDSLVAAAVGESDKHICDLLASLVVQARSEGEIPKHVDPEVTAWAVMALMEGVGSQLLYSPVPEEEIRSRLEVVISTLLS